MKLFGRALKSHLNSNDLLKVFRLELLVLMCNINWIEKCFRHREPRYN